MKYINSLSVLRSNEKIWSTRTSNFKTNILLFFPSPINYYYYNIPFNHRAIARILFSIQTIYEIKASIVQSRLVPKDITLILKSCSSLKPRDIIARSSDNNKRGSSRDSRTLEWIGKILCGIVRSINTPTSNP